MNTPKKSSTIVFIHGLFQNPTSWKQWQHFFSKRGFTSHAFAYPYHDGDPQQLRRMSDPALGRLDFQTVIDHLTEQIRQLPEEPILIGHSMGGLAVQKLIASDIGIAGVCIDPAPPRGVFSFEKSFLQLNMATINPLKGNSVFLPSVEWFQRAFCNTMTLEQTQVEYDAVVVPESRNIARSILGSVGKINMKAPHKPLLFVAGEEDTIVPHSLIQKNYRAYTDKSSVTDFMSFAGRSHYICGQPGWEEVADNIHTWILAQE